MRKTNEQIYIETIVEGYIKPLQKEISDLRIELNETKEQLRLHIVSNALFCENCNGSHLHTKYGNGEFRCDNCDNVAKL